MIFLSLIFDVFKTLLVLKPNLKEVTEAISPFDFVFRFSTMENLITIKETGNCNTVYNDCLIGLESWSNILLRNKPVTDSSPMGTLITFNLGRKTQFYISSTGAYSRVNQSQQDETTWTAWVKLS